MLAQIEGHVGGRIKGMSLNFLIFELGWNWRMMHLLGGESDKK
jgi:hypothetical protein